MAENDSLQYFTTHYIFKNVFLLQAPDPLAKKSFNHPNLCFVTIKMISNIERNILQSRIYLSHKRFKVQEGSMVKSKELF